MQKISKAYEKMIAEMVGSKSDENDRIASAWKKTLEMSPSQYAWYADKEGKIPAHQKIPSSENEKSKNAASEYIRTHKHSFGASNPELKVLKFY
jgi:hypothetical protein